MTSPFLTIMDDYYGLLRMTYLFLSIHFLTSSLILLFISLHLHIFSISFSILCIQHILLYLFLYFLFSTFLHLKRIFIVLCPLLLPFCLFNKILFLIPFSFLSVSLSPSLYRRMFYNSFIYLI